MYKGDASRTGYVPIGAGGKSPDLRWRQRVGTRFYGSPIVSSGQVYVLGYSEQQAGIYALAEASGAVRWMYPLSSVPPNWTITLAAAETVVFAGEQARVLALDQTTGELRASTTPFPKDWYVSGNPAVSGGRLYLSTKPWGFHAFHTDTLYDAWGCDAPSVLRLGDSPAVGTGRVYFSTASGIFCLEAITGRFLWWDVLAEGMIQGVSCPVVDRAELYLLVFGHEVSICRYDGITGACVWKQMITVLPEGVRPEVIGEGILPSPAMDAQRLYLGAGHSIWAVKRHDGSIVWQFRTGSIVKSSPAVTDRCVYCGSSDGHLYALSPSTGGKHWQFKCQDRVLSSPAVTETGVYVGDRSGWIYALGH